MDLHAYASQETSALIAQLLGAQAGAAAEQIDALRHALEALTRAMASPAGVEEPVRDLVSRLVRTAEDEIQRVREETGAALDRAREELRVSREAHETIAGQLAGAHADTETLRSQLATAHADSAALRSELATAQADSATLRSELDAARGREAEAQQRVSAELEIRAAAEASLGTVTRQVQDARQANSTLEAHLSDAQETIRQLRLELEHLRTLRGQLETALETSTVRLEDLENELAAAQEIQGQRDALASDLHASNARIRTLEVELAMASKIAEQRDALAGELDAAAARLRALEAEMVKAHELRQHRDALAGQLATAHARVHALEADIARLAALGQEHDDGARAQTGRVRELEAELAAACSLRDARIDALEHELDTVRQLLEHPATSSGGAGAGSPEQLEQVRADRDRMMSLFDASARAFSELASVKDSSLLLKELVRHMSRQFSRVALFRVRNDRLAGDYQIGLSQVADISSVLMPASADSILTRAIASGNCESLSGDDVSARSGVPFGGAPTSAIALPITVQDATLAVVYADDADMPESARGPAVHESGVAYARLLVDHTIALLARHTHELKILAELSQYATTLLQEAKEMYLADVEAGKPADVVRSRLKDNIDCASQLYAYRAAMEGPAAASLLDEQILAELQESTSFALDLAAVLAETAKNELNITAEAS